MKTSYAKYFKAGSALEAANATWVWRQLAMRNWMPRAVTLTSIVLRFIIGVQATVCTSMVAALLLERLSVPRSQAAHASIMRGINDGPWKLLMLVLSYKARVSQILWHLEAWLILLVALLSLALQFTSTILLSDMHSFIMIGDLNTTTANSLFAFPEREEFALFAGDLMATIPVYPVFGEVPTTHDSSPDSRGFSDTGLQQRGLLPMPGSDTRTSVREYDGMGMVMSSRVACMRPVITNASITNVSLDLIDHIYGRLEGVLEFGQALDEARPGTGSSCDSSEECERLAFDCSIPAAYNATELWAPGACVIDGVGGNIRSSAQPTWDPAGGPWSENSSVWLLYSTDLEDEEWESLPPDGSMPPGQPVGDSEWTIYEVVPGHFIKLSACFSDFNFAHRDIRMTAAGATTERSTPWSLLLSKDFKMDEVETYLGLNPSHQAIADRGVLDLQIKPDDNAPYIPPPPYEELLDLPDDEITPTALTVNSIQLETIFGLTNGITKNTTFTLCGRCTIDAITVHMDYASLFSSVVLGETTGGEGRAADALHAFISLVGFNIYDQFLAGTMDVAEEVRLVTTLEVTVPGSWPPTRAACAGFIAVVSLLVAYLALVAGITVLYVRHTRYSRYGNVWHVISQLVASEELGETLELGNNASDKSVVKDLRTKGSSKDASDVVLVKLGKADGCENIKVSKFGT